MDALQNYYFAGFLYILFVSIPWLILFVERSIVEKLFEKSFIKAWSIIYIIVVILAYIGGHVDTIVPELSSFSRAFAYLLGNAIGAITLSLILTYLYALIKIPFIWIHKLTNKKNDE